VFDWITSTVRATGYPGIALLMFVENFDASVFRTPGYNHGTSAALKKVWIISYGSYTTNQTRSSG
jgi:hypothetical protein